MHIFDLLYVLCFIIINKPLFHQDFLFSQAKKESKGGFESNLIKIGWQFDL